MIHLLNNCRRSKFAVFPANWKEKDADFSAKWYINYRFQDPNFKDQYPKGKLVVVKGGINRTSSLTEKRSTTKFFLEELEKGLAAGYNPITEKVIPQKVTDPVVVHDVPLTDVLPTTGFIKALRFALTKSTNVIEAKHDMKSMLKYLEQAAIALKMEDTIIFDIRSGDIKRCLDYCVANNPTFTHKRFNKARAYLMGLFGILLEVNAASGNAPRDVKIIAVPITKRDVLTPAEIKKVKEHLWKNNRPFYDFMMIFFHSGARAKELMTLKGKDVDLINQTYTTLIKKGKQREVPRTIRNNALPYWIKQMETCKPTDYVFSNDLLPGPTLISARQTTIRWRRHVKIPLKITADFYSLKHLNMDATVAALGLKAAAGQAGHMSTEMAKKVYAYNEGKREHEDLKGVDIVL